MIAADELPTARDLAYLEAGRTEGFAAGLAEAEERLRQEWAVRRQIVAGVLSHWRAVGPRPAAWRDDIDEAER